MVICIISISNVGGGLCCLWGGNAVADRAPLEEARHGRVEETIQGGENNIELHILPKYRLSGLFKVYIYQRLYINAVNYFCLKY